MTPGRDHEMVAACKRVLVAHDDAADKIKHVCKDMSAAYAKGMADSLPQAQINYDRFQVIALANTAMEEVRREEMRTRQKAVRAALGGDDWTYHQISSMHWLRRSNLKNTRQVVRPMTNANLADLLMHVKVEVTVTLRTRP